MAIGRAQGSKLSKCIDLSTKRTVAKLESRIFHRDKFVLSSESEPLGPMLLLSACKVSSFLTGPS